MHFRAGNHYMQAQQLGKLKRLELVLKQIPPWIWVCVCIIFLGIIIWVILAAYILHTSKDNTDAATSLTIISILILVPVGLLTLVVALVAWQRPKAPSPDPSDLSKALQKFSNEKTPDRYIQTRPFSVNSETTLKREEVVKEIYKLLVEGETSAVVLTGIVGIGKSYLANLLYQEVEYQRHHSKKDFISETIWLKFTPDVISDSSSFTIADLARKLCRDLPTNFDGSSPWDQASQLFELLNKSKKRLVVLDQFDVLLDWQTGQVLDKCRGIDRFLDELHNQPCHCRFLLTSCLYPQGTNVPFSNHVKEYQVKDLKGTEGITLLRKLIIEASEEDLRKAVEQCDGHPFALSLLANLWHHDPMQSSTAFFTEPNTQRWREEIADKCLRNMDKRLNTIQQKLLRAFSVYREPVPKEATQGITDRAEVPDDQVPRALEVLLAQHLLRPKREGEGYYQPYTIVAGYARDHFSSIGKDEQTNENDKQENRTALHAAHAKAALYYKNIVLPRERRLYKKDVHPLIEAAWHECQAGRKQEAYDLIKDENILEHLL